MKSEKTNIAWHPAFVQAIKLELEEYHDSLEFFPEYQLTTEPLRIDCVVIKKAKGVVIRKNIASIFRDINLIEYKSSDDHLSVWDFYKVYSYACLYSSLGKAPISSMTLTFISSRYPREIMKHLKEVRNFSVEENSKGIYTVKGDVIAMQIIDNRKLSVKENLWLQGLRKNLDTQSVIRVSKKVIINPGNTGAFLDAIVRANYGVLKEFKTMKKMTKSLREALISTGWTEEWIAMGEARAEKRAKAKVEENRKEIAAKMLKSGYPLKEVSSMTGLDSKKVMKIKASTGKKTSAPTRANSR